jgi:hypothetical protein
MEIFYLVTRSRPFVRSQTLRILTTRHRAVTVACKHQGRVPASYGHWPGTDGEQHAADYHQRVA